MSVEKVKCHLGDDGLYEIEVKADGYMLVFKCFEPVDVYQDISGGKLCELLGEAGQKISAYLDPIIR